MHGMFTGIEQMESSGGEPYPLPGTYLLAFESCATGTSKRQGSPFIARNYLILDSNNPERPAGTRMGFVDMLAQYREVKLANFKTELAALFRVSESQVTEQACNDLFTDGGARMKHRVFVKVTCTNENKASGGLFTKARWSALDDNGLAHAARRLQEVTAAGFVPKALPAQPQQQPQTSPPQWQPQPQTAQSQQPWQPQQQPQAAPQQPSPWPPPPVDDIPF